MPRSLGILQDQRIVPDYKRSIFPGTHQGPPAHSDQISQLIDVVAMSGDDFADIVAPATGA